MRATVGQDVALSKLAKTRNNAYSTTVVIKISMASAMAIEETHTGPHSKCLMLDSLYQVKVMNLYI